MSFIASFTAAHACRPEEEAGLLGVIGAVDELIAVIEAENRLLARGMPASLSRSTERKSSLAAILSAALAGSESRAAVKALSPAAKAHLADRINVAQRAIDENATRLEAAMRASRRRIAAVMAAVREQANRVDVPAGYGASGRRPMGQAAGVMARGQVV